MELYSAKSYKDILVGQLHRPKTFQAMAEHCRIQKTYLSKVLNHEGHLNDDQLYAAAEYLELSPNEIEFTLLLHSFERSIHPGRRKQLEKQLDAIRTSKQKTESKLKVDTSENQETAAYYLDPLYQVIHMMLTVERYGRDIKSIATQLNLPMDKLHTYLNGLEKMGIVSRTSPKSSQFKVLRDNLHLSQDSYLHSAYSTQLRLRALERMRVLSSEDGYSFSVVFSTNAHTRRKIHSSFLTWIQSVQKLVKTSSEDEVYQLNFDLLNWTS